MAFIFYYLLLTVFVWLFIYTLFLQSRVTPVFNSSKYNSYKIYLAIGYGNDVCNFNFDLIFNFNCNTGLYYGLCMQAYFQVNFEHFTFPLLICTSHCTTLLGHHFYPLNSYYDLINH